MKKQLLLLTTFLLPFALVQLGAQIKYQVKDFQMTIAGTSSLHDWESDAKSLTASGQFVADGTLKDISNLTVEIPVTEIQSSKGSMMDKKTWKALESDDHPNIIYRLTDVKSIESTGSDLKITASGKLTIAGTTKDISLTVTGKKLSDGSFQFTGSKPLKMTTFNIDPPTALLGTLKTGDDITIKFNLTMAPTASR